MMLNKLEELTNALEQLTGLRNIKVRAIKETSSAHGHARSKNENEITHFVECILEVEYMGTSHAILTKDTQANNGETTTA